MEISKENLVNVYNFGSKIYGTYNMNPEHPSDKDYIKVVKEFVTSDNIDVHIFTVEQFQSLLNDHDIQMLECYFSDDVCKYETHYFDFKLDLSKLRTSISTIVSNSFVKGKKKLIVTGDYNEWLGLKSIFHSLRILDYGIQIAEHGKIVNFKSMNYVLEDLIKMSKVDQRNELWDAIETKYKSIYNSMNSRFKILCPKDLTEKNKKSKLIKILSEYNINNEDLVNELLTIF